MLFSLARCHLLSAVDNVAPKERDFISLAQCAAIRTAAVVVIAKVALEDDEASFVV